MPLLRLLLLSLLALLPLPGCQVPDVHPFAEATSAMGTALQGSLQQVATDLQRLDSLRPTALGAAQQAQLAQAEATVRGAAGRFAAIPPALASYANSLVTIAERQASTEAKVATAAQSVQGLSKVVGAWGAAVGVGAGLLGKLAQSATSYAALRKLEAKLAANDSAIQLTAAVLASGLQQFARIDSTAIAILLLNNQLAQRLPTQYYQAAVQRRANAQRVLLALTELANTQTLLDQRCDTCRAPASQATYEARRTAARARRRAYLAELATLDPQVRAASPDDRAAVARQRERYYLEQATLPPGLQAQYDAVQAQRRHLQDTYYQAHTLMQKSAALARQWASSHQALYASVRRERHQLPYQDLVAQAQDLRKLVDELAALKH